MAENSRCGSSNQSPFDFEEEEENLSMERVWRRHRALTAAEAALYHITTLHRSWQLCPVRPILFP
eukprot:SAG31_NODE_6664_length_1934_cov_1.401635_2_plen_64_part_01